MECQECSTCSATYNVGATSCARSCDSICKQYVAARKDTCVSNSTDTMTCKPHCLLDWSSCCSRLPRGYSACGATCDVDNVDYRHCYGWREPVPGCCTVGNTSAVCKRVRAGRCRHDVGAPGEVHQEGGVQLPTEDERGRVWQPCGAVASGACVL